MTEQEEQYLHLVTCIEDLNNTWRLLHQIKQCDGNPLLDAAFQFSLIQYSKPYKYARGSVLSSYRLDELHIPTEHAELHKRIINARDQIHAHSDLTVREAELYVKKASDRNIVTQIRNVISFTEELSNIDSIINLIEQSLDNLYKKSKQLENDLPINS